MSKRKEKKCGCGGDVVPGTAWCFVCNPAYPADARREYFRAMDLDPQDDADFGHSMGLDNGD